MSMPLERALMLGPAIRARRKELGIKQYVLANVLHLDTSIVSLWEVNRRAVPTTRVDALAAALQTTVVWLCAQSGEAPPKPSQIVPPPAEPEEEAEEEAPPRRPGLERLEAYSLHPFFGRSPAPGRPRPAA